MSVVTSYFGFAKMTQFELKSISIPSVLMNLRYANIQIWNETIGYKTVSFCRSYGLIYDNIDIVRVFALIVKDSR